MSSSHYDVVIVGAGIAGSALAYALSSNPRKGAKPLRVCLLERSLSEPDRIVGELLQPGGVIALKRLGMTDCLEGIDAVPTYGYCVYENGSSVHIPYPEGYEGRSFHHGGFVQSLRRKAISVEALDVVEATVTELLECDVTHKVIGVRAKPKAGQLNGSTAGKHTFYADLVVFSDGYASGFRKAVMGGAGVDSVTKSHFVGAILEDVTLPIPKHGTVALCKGAGPVLLYQIGEHDTRMLVDIKNPLPSDIKEHILTKIVPQLPPSLTSAIHTCLSKDRALRRMPNSFLPPAEQGSHHQKEGAILLGDAWNTRHPLTGGGMTVAFNDVVILSELLREVADLGRWDEVARALHAWHWRRKGLAATINILSVALYDLFGAEDENLAVLRRGCFKYFECGGECINGPVSLLSGIAPDPLLLAYHFFYVAFYSIWVMFTHPLPQSTEPGEKPILRAATIDEYPGLLFKSFAVFWTACAVFGPLLWTEIRWW